MLVASLLTGALVVAPRAEAPFTGLSVTPGAYGHPGLIRYPYVYVPGETLTFTMAGDTAGELFDALVIVLSTAQILQAYNDIAMPTSRSIALTYTIPSALPDGDNYEVEIGDSNWIESGRTSTRFAFQRFVVQAYELTVDVDRPAYLGGDTVIAAWSANSLKDGSLAPDGFGQIWVYDTAGMPHITPSPFTTSIAAGVLSFRLPDLADPRFDGIVQMWFNDTPSNPTRFQLRLAFFAIDYLGVIVTASPPQSAPGEVVTIHVRTVVTPGPANPSPFDPPEPGMDVDITVWEIPPVGPPVERPQYGVSGLVTDARGELTYLFELDATAAPTDYEVRVNASHPSGIWRWLGTDMFAVSPSAGLTQVLQFNQAAYQAGDTATVASIVTGAGGATLAYVFEVRDTTSALCTAAFADGGLLARSTQATNTYSYSIPASFAGRICFRVTVDDGQGNRVTGAREFNVVFGWLLVNADRAEYQSGDAITVSWELVSNRLLNPAYFYEVRDRDGNAVASGTTGTARSLSFVVPNPASNAYTFTVIASESGRTVSGTVTVGRVAGFFLTLSFDRPAYAPGAIIRVHYRLTARAPDVPYPTVLVFEFGLLAAPPQSFTTTSREGDLTSLVPAGIDEGPQLFAALERGTGTQALEVLTIDGTDPTVGDPFAGPSVAGTPITVRVNVSDNLGPVIVRLHWGYSDGTNGTVARTGDSSGTYTAVVPARSAAGTLDAFVTAEDAAGNAAQSSTIRLTVAAAPDDGTGTPASGAPAWLDLTALAVSAVAIALSLTAIIRRRGGGRASEPKSPPPSS